MAAVQYVLSGGTSTHFTLAISVLRPLEHTPLPQIPGTVLPMKLDSGYQRVEGFKMAPASSILGSVVLFYCPESSGPWTVPLSHVSPM